MNKEHGGNYHQKKFNLDIEEITVTFKKVDLKLLKKGL
jgi:hypothetical protein